MGLYIPLINNSYFSVIYFVLKANGYISWTAKRVIFVVNKESEESSILTREIKSGKVLALKSCVA